MRTEETILNIFFFEAQKDQDQKNNSLLILNELLLCYQIKDTSVINWGYLTKPGPGV